MRALLFLLALAESVTGGQAQDPWKDVYRVSAWEDRDTWQKPGELIRLMKVKPGSRVADVGCHEGYMTVKLAASVGTSGKVYAVDVEESKLARLQANLSERGLDNAETILGAYGNPRLPQDLDAVLILDAYHEMDEHQEILSHILRSLKPEGRLVICEAVADSRKSSSRSEQEGKHELGMNYALEDLRAAGFLVLAHNGNFVDRTQVKGDRMWVIVAGRPPGD
jgi:predicted methyltransferase